jgi:hypothetical protein
MNPTDTEQAISILNAFISTQQPLLDVVKFAVEILQGKYDEQLKSGDFKVINDRVKIAEALVVEKDESIASLTTIISEKDAIITDLANPKDFSADVPNS